MVAKESKSSPTQGRSAGRPRVVLKRRGKTAGSGETKAADAAKPQSEPPAARQRQAATKPAEKRAATQVADEAAATKPAAKSASKPAGRRRVVLKGRAKAANASKAAKLQSEPLTVQDEQATTTPADKPAAAKPASKPAEQRARRTRVVLKTGAKTKTTDEPAAVEEPAVAEVAAEPAVAKAAAEPASGVTGIAADKLGEPRATKQERGWIISAVAVLSLIFLAEGLFLWAITWPKIDPRGLTDYGIIAILPWQFWLALTAVALGFALSLHQRLAASVLPYLNLLGLVVMLHATPPLVYGSLRYSWAWKHIGIVDFIQRHGTVDTVAPFLAAYHNWPGLFYVSAKVANALGMTPVEIADSVRFAPVVLTSLFVLALVPIYRRLTDDPRLVVAAIWLFITGNWIGQDYYSPQAVAFLFYLLIIGICLGPIRRMPPSVDDAGNWLSRLIARTRAWLANSSEHPARQYGPLARAGFAMLVMILIMATTATHQLTPMAILFMLIGLAILGRISIYYFVVAAVAEILWLLYFAAPFMVFHLADEINTFGEGINAAQDRLVDISVVSAGRVSVIVAGRALTAAIGAFALLGGLRRLLAGSRDGLAVILMGAAFPLLLNTYGGEIVFRVYLFALPMLAFFSAAVVFPARDRGRHPIWRVMFLPLSILAAIGFLYGNNGKDRQYYFTRDEIEASQWLYGNAPPGSLLIEGARNYPSQFMNYENFVYVPISRERQQVREEIIAAPDDIFARWLSDPKWKSGYIIITSSQKAYSDAEGVMPTGALDLIEDKLLRSPRFVLAYATPNAKIFSLHPSIGVMGPWTKEIVEASPGPDPAPGAEPAPARE